MTRNRVGNALAVAAAVVGLVLVFSGAGHGDDAPAAPPPSSHVVPAPARVTAPGPEVQTRAPASAAPPSKDAGGVHDG